MSQAAGSVFRRVAANSSGVGGAGHVVGVPSSAWLEPA